VVVFQFPFFPHAHDVGQLVVHPPSRIVSHPKETRSWPDFYSLIRPPGRPFALGRGRILIPGFIWFPPMLAAYSEVKGE